MKNCRYCGEEIDTSLKNYNKRSFCRSECSASFYRKRAKERAWVKNNTNPDWNKERKCVLCDQTFIPKSSNSKFCSKKCSSSLTDFNYVSTHLVELENRGLLKNNVADWLKLRIFILNRDSFSCQYCGRSPMKEKVVLHIDHKIPRNKGGTNDISNLITSCQECNLGKGDILLSYWENSKKCKNEILNNKD